jgi:hypothetical protein
MATPIHSGIAAKPSRAKTVPGGVPSARMPSAMPTKARAEPVVSHFSCWRRYRPAMD